MRIPLLIASTLGLLTLADDPAAVGGRRIDLGGASLFVGEEFRPRGDRIDVLIHLHGAPGAVEPAFVESGWSRRGVLVEFNRNGLSSVYAEPFTDPSLFPTLLEKTREALRREGIVAEPEPGRVIVSAFSAGFGGVRELLKVREHFERIDAIVLADSLYCGYRDDRREPGLDPEKMAGFRRFATEAAEGRKALIVTHSAQVPEGYASTTETADDLIAHVGADCDARRDDLDGWVRTRRCERGKFLVLGFAGAEAEDHLRHLRGIGTFWKELARRLPDV